MNSLQLPIHYLLKTGRFDMSHVYPAYETQYIKE